MLVLDRDAAANETQSVEFTYDALDRRISKSVSTATDEAITHFVYDREDVILDFVDNDGSGPATSTLAVRYLHGPGVDQVFSQEVANQQTTWLLDDHLGSTRAIADGAGQVVDRIDYDSFGSIVGETNISATSRYLFTAREWDRETGIQYSRFRYFAPEMGRFLSEDPLRVSSNDANLFRYVVNRPIHDVDPFGLEPPNSEPLFGSPRLRETYNQMIALQQRLREIEDQQRQSKQSPLGIARSACGLEEKLEIDSGAPIPNLPSIYDLVKKVPVSAACAFLSLCDTLSGGDIPGKRLEFEAAETRFYLKAAEEEFRRIYREDVGFDPFGFKRRPGSGGTQPSGANNTYLP